MAWSIVLRVVGILMFAFIAIAVVGLTFGGHHGTPVNVGLGFLLLATVAVLAFVLTAAWEGADTFWLFAYGVAVSCALVGLGVAEFRVDYLGWHGDRVNAVVGDPQCRLARSKAAKSNTWNTYQVCNYPLMLPDGRLLEGGTKRGYRQEDVREGRVEIYLDPVGLAGHADAAEVDHPLSRLYLSLAIGAYAGSYALCLVAGDRRWLRRQPPSR
ncbi:hypothetical protein Lfu02_77240 [Longispora fulva]|uniref:hypothetical protein n=1 Tax=Longispora fulva TaxID=619741 RepID=UPI001A4F26BD|nr:hypothetical protein Lfu02_77240 [Longispora fulva]